jgi:hypothetical protein
MKGMSCMPNDQERGAVDERKLNKMKYLILELEQRNLNTGEKTADEMVELIRKTIASVADKAY